MKKVNNTSNCCDAEILQPESNGHGKCSDCKENAVPTAFEDVVKPLMKYLAQYHNPHTTVIVTATEAELLIGKSSVVTNEFLVD